MNADRWMKLQKNVTLLSGLMIASFWLVYFYPDMWYVGVLMLAYQGQQFWEGMKIDTADERAELIAARAGFLSQKLMLGVGIGIFALERKHTLDGAWPLIAVMLVGSLSEAAFRKMLGAEERKMKWSALGLAVVGCTVLLAGLLVWSMWKAG